MRKVWDLSDGSQNRLRQPQDGDNILTRNLGESQVSDPTRRTRRQTTQEEAMLVRTATCGEGSQHA